MDKLHNSMTTAVSKQILFFTAKSSLILLAFFVSGYACSVFFFLFCVMPFDDYSIIIVAKDKAVPDSSRSLPEAGDDKTGPGLYT